MSVYGPAFWPSRVTWSFIQHKASEEHRWSVTVQGKQHELWPLICLRVLTLLQMIQLSWPKSTIAVNQAMGYLKRSMFNLSVTCSRGYTHAWEYTSLSCSVVEKGLRQTGQKWAFRKSQSPPLKEKAPYKWIGIMLLIIYAMASRRQTLCSIILLSCRVQ